MSTARSYPDNVSNRFRVHSIMENNNEFFSEDILECIVTAMASGWEEQHEELDAFMLAASQEYERANAPPTTTVLLLLLVIQEWVQRHRVDPPATSALWPEG